jgi:hypothetical protein
MLPMVALRNLILRLAVYRDANGLLLAQCRCHSNVACDVPTTLNPRTLHPAVGAKGGAKMGIVILVCFVMVMFLWLLSLLGAVPNAPNYSPWLAWFACLFLGLIVFIGVGGWSHFAP